ncbi:hypothetical protein ACFQ0B_71075 [Nonomuraea thailandensis]
MRQRIRGVGGHVEVQSTPGEGTSVSARVPAIAPGGTRAEGRPADDSARDRRRPSDREERSSRHLRRRRGHRRGR